MPNEDTRFEIRLTADLEAPQRTARLHPEPQIERLMRSIERFGFIAPIIITGRGEIVAGEARWLAAKRLRRSSVPVVIAEHLSAAQVEAYRIADNRLAEDAEWDDALLALIVRDLDLALTADDLSAIGFASHELSALLGAIDPIEPPVLPTHERAPFQRLTFVLHDSQMEVIGRALAKAKSAGPFVGSLNANSNGNALARICVVAPIARADADRTVRMFHYSRSVVRNSQLHLGVFLAGRLEGAMQFGPPLDKRKAHTLVAETPWNGMLELNRMAFGPRLPRNSESRALGFALRWLRRTQTHLQWVLSYADGAQCGDGTIYRATGFVLTSIKKNTAIWSDGAGGTVNRVSVTTHRADMVDGGASMRAVRAAGGEPLPGYQLRYIKFLDAGASARLTVPILPYCAIAEVGARMYLGKPFSE